MHVGTHLPTKQVTMLFKTNFSMSQILTFNVRDPGDLLRSFTCLERTDEQMTDNCLALVLLIFPCLHVC